MRRIAAALERYGDQRGLRVSEHGGTCTLLLEGEDRLGRRRRLAAITAAREDLDALTRMGVIGAATLTLTPLRRAYARERLSLR